ncbi:MAG: DNA polymerase I, partial [Actinomycetota bacterium]|nr:DNA polymerase I [Actinomycetota bacterium]
FLLDGNSLTYRAFFAIPRDMVTASGQETNAVFGFTQMLISLLRDHEPDGVAVAFDRPGGTFRHDRLPSYKANREKQEDSLYQQLDLVRELVDALGLLVAEADGYEADDVIATLATVARDAGRDVTVVTGDRDSYQLVEDPHVQVLYNKRGVSDYALYDEAGILERTGVRPADYVAYAALRGDPSDNLPGVPGVGEKTAAKLVNAYGGLDGIFAAAGDQTPKLSQNLSENEQHARLNAELMVLVRDVPLGLEIGDLERGPVDVERAGGLLGMLEMGRARERLGSLLEVGFGGLAAAEEPSSELEIRLERCTDTTAVAAAVEALSGGVVGVATEADPAVEATGPGLGGGLAISDGQRSWWIDEAVLTEATEVLLSLLGPGGSGVVAHDAKPLLRALGRRGIVDIGLVLDTALAAYLLDPADTAYDLGALLERHTGQVLPAAGPPDGQLDLTGEAADPAAEAGARAAAAQSLHDPLIAALDAQGLRELNATLEVPLVAVLARMEEVGVGVDVTELTRLRGDLTADCDRLRGLVHEAAGEEFNVNSTKQLREVLFENLGLTPGKKTKTGYSTDAATLERLRDDHPVVGHLLAYREVEKLRSTYGEGLLAEVGPGDRIRATFNQTVARTGRLSSDAPNLHNIPVRTEAGRAFRRAFVPSPGRSLLVADYNQIELRCIAHLADDPGLIAAFEAGDDVHTAVASRTWGIQPSEVTTEIRNRAKMVAYGLAYGMEAYGLSQRLGSSVDEASEILDSYFAAFPAVRAYMDRTVDEARQKGYTETLFGRRRRIPELSSPNYNVRQAGERQAMNAGIQGLAADVFKVALIRIDGGLRASGAASELILQVHDEVILEVPPDEMQDVEALVRAEMTGAYDLRVELAVDVADGATWADAKG